MIGGLGIWELIIILVIILIIFGAGKLPELGSSLGRGIKSFRKAIKEPDEIDITPKQGEKEDKDKKEETGSK